MNIQPIVNFDGYFIDTNGNVYSNKSGSLRTLNPYRDTKGRYLMIRLIRNDGVRKSLLIHRIVAQIFIPNPDRLPEVNHKDNNPGNPKAENLEWIDRKGNLEQSYLTLSPTRNYNTCELYIDNIKIGDFKSILSACRYAKEHYNAKTKQLEKHLRWQNIIIIPQKKTRKNMAV